MFLCLRNECEKMRWAVQKNYATDAMGVLGFLNENRYANWTDCTRTNVRKERLNNGNIVPEF